MKHDSKNIIIANLIASTVLAAGAAGATDHRMWREQVPLSAGSAIELESESVDPAKKRANNTLPWREQVKIVDNNRIFIPKPALNRHGDLDDGLMWREQLRSNASERELTATHDPQLSGSN